MVFSRLVSSGPGCTVIADPEPPSSRHNMKGIVKMPSRFEETVSSRASAVLPPTVCRAPQWASCNMLAGRHPCESSLARLCCLYKQFLQHAIHSGMLIC